MASLFYIKTEQSDSKFNSVVLFGDTSFEKKTKSASGFDATINYIISTGRFDEALFNSSWLNKI